VRLLYPLSLIGLGALAIILAWPFLPFLVFMGTAAFGAGLALLGMSPELRRSTQDPSAASE